MTFDKKQYWSRRKKGLHGQIHPVGNKENRYDLRVILRTVKKDRLDKLRKGENDSG